MKILLGLGGNLDDTDARFDAVKEALAHLPHTAVLRESTRRRTAPVGYLEQPDFLNSVVEIETALSPQALLGACLGIEATLGRVRTFPNAPRTVDIDVLLCDGFESDSSELTVPHPRMWEREFVLTPLWELFPDGAVYGRAIPAL